MKNLILLLIFSSFSSGLFSQADTLLDFPFDYREHFSGQKGKWNFSGERLYQDSVLFYSSVYETLPGDNSVYFFERKWYYTNGKLERHIILNFKKRKRALLTDKSYSEEGKLIDEVIKKANRKPEETDPKVINWKE